MKMCCPHCGVKGSVDDSYQGKKVSCPKCQEIFVVPEETPPIFPDQVEEQITAEETELSASDADDIDEEIALEDNLNDLLDDQVDEQVEEQEELADTVADIEEETEVDLEVDSFFDNETEEDELLDVTDEDSVEETLDLSESLDDSENIDVALGEEDSDLFSIDEEEDELEIDFSDDEPDQEELVELEESDVDQEDIENDAIADELISEESEELILAEEDAESEDVVKDLSETNDDSVQMREDDSELILAVDEEPGDASDKDKLDASIEEKEMEADYEAFLASSVDEKEASVVEEGSKTKKKKEKKVKENIQHTFSLETFTVFGSIKEAWKYTKGAKFAVLLATFILGLISAGLNSLVSFGIPELKNVLGTAMAGVSSVSYMWIEILASSVASFLTSVLAAGVLYMGVKWVKDGEISWKMLFAGFKRFFAIFFAFLFMTLMVMSGFVLLVLPGIYLAIGYMLTLPLIIEKGMQPWEAMEASRKAIHKVWWKVLGIFIVMEVILVAACIPAGLGLIWAIPMYVVLIGVIYRMLFVEKGAVSQ